MMQLPGGEGQMNKTMSFTKAISIILFCAFLGYIAVFAVQCVTSPIRTVLAVPVTVDYRFYGEGIIVREEEVLIHAHQTASPLVRAGERIHFGQAVLRAYPTAEAASISFRRQRLEEEIERVYHHINELAMYRTLSGARADVAIRRGIEYLSRAVLRGDLHELNTHTVALNSLFLGADAENLLLRLDTLYADLAALGDSAHCGEIIAATHAGIFYPRTDGFEFLSPGDIAQMTPLSVQNLLTQAPAVSENTVGTIITSSRWYFLLPLPVQAANSMASSVGQVVDIAFADLPHALPMHLDSIGKSENGYKLAIFSSSADLSQILHLRRTRAEVTYGSFTGIRVPRRALHWRVLESDDPGNTEEIVYYVFTQGIVTAERKHVHIVYPDSSFGLSADYYLVVPNTQLTSVAAAFRAGNIILISDEDLYDGMLLR